MGRALVDANVLVAAYRPGDALYDKAVSLIQKLKKTGWRFVMTNLLMQETATVLSMRVGMELAKKFHKDYVDIIDEEVFVDKDTEKKGWEIFLSQKKKGTSFVDCANMATIEKYKLDGIVTFDEFYPKELLIR
jgi:predicted nucleic acid-binding protein